MAIYLRPRRGKQAAASSAAIVLKKGEVFFEIAASGISTGENAKACGKIKMGDGTTVYSNLGYFIDVETSYIDFTDTGTATSENQGADYYSNLNAINPSSYFKDIVTNMKNIVYKLATDVTYEQNNPSLAGWKFIAATGQKGQGTPKTGYRVNTDWTKYNELMIACCRTYRSNANYYGYLLADPAVYPITNNIEEGDTSAQNAYIKLDTIQSVKDTPATNYRLGTVVTTGGTASNKKIYKVENTKAPIYINLFRSTFSWGESTSYAYVRLKYEVGQDGTRKYFCDLYTDGTNAGSRDTTYGGFKLYAVLFMR